MVKKEKKKYFWAGWSMVFLASALVLIFSYIPMVQAFLLSLKTGKGANLHFAGLANYARMLKDDTFWTTITNTLIYAVVQIPVMLILALLIAVFLNDPKIKLRGVYRTCIFLPCVTSLISYAILFKNLFDVDGIVNRALLNLHLIDKAIPFVLDPFWSKVVIIIALIWRYTGYYMIFFLSAMQNIDKSVYEAAKMDGCSFFQSFSKITLPLLKPIVFLTSIMSLNSTLQLFDEVVNLTDGGPGNATRTISQYIYDLSFTFVPSYGYSAAVSYVVLLLVIVLTIFQKGITSEKDESR
jgi:lactose/L-arabinose transport system permease protein